MQLSTWGKWIFLSIAALCTVIAIVVPIVTHSIRNVWYGPTVLVFIVGIYDISLGAKKLGIERQNGQTAIWYKDYMIDMGIMCLLLVFLEVIAQVSDNLSAFIRVNVTYALTGFFGVGALVFLILAMKYRPNRASTS